MTHGFNCPHQLSASNGSDRAENGDLYAFSVQPGDTIVLATDGCFDNMWDREIGQLIDDHRGIDAELTAHAITERARLTSQARKGDSPFATSARKSGYTIEGGKPDDITVICIRVLGPRPPDDTRRSKL